MDFTNIDVDRLISDFEHARSELNLSYQNIADSCNVSQATILRIFKRQTEPTVKLLQQIAAAVRYVPEREEIILTAYTQDAYILFLQKTIERTKEDAEIQMKQNEAVHNRRHNEDRRSYHHALIFAVCMALFICGLFAYDLSHLDRGWFQMAAEGYRQSVFKDILFAVQSWLGI